MRLFILSFTLLVLFGQASAQSEFVFNDQVLPKIYIQIHPDTLAIVLNPDNALSREEYPATFRYVSGPVDTTFHNVGFRLRGNTSRFAQKKSFKLKFAKFESGRRFFGLKDMDLNGEHNDPSVIRAKLAWDLFNAFGVISSRANHVEVYINNEYRGLYIHTEDIDDIFLRRHFSDYQGNLYKCLWPADLTYRGTDPDAYKFTSNDRRAYELKTNEDEDDYTGFAHFIHQLTQLNNTNFSREVEDFLNVDGLLRAYALNTLVGSWDDYWFNKNNFYLYQDSKGIMHFIPYDYDNTFGIWWSGILANVDWTTRNPYAFGHPTESRPMLNRVLNIQEYRDRYSYYMKQAMDELFRMDIMEPEIDRLRDMISDAAERDTWRSADYGWSYQQFLSSYTQALGAHVTYGLKPFISARRTSAQEQLIIRNIRPVIRNVQLAFLQDQQLQGVRFELEDDDTNVALYLHLSTNGTDFTVTPAVNTSELKGTYTLEIPVEYRFSPELWYFIRAVDPDNQTTRFPRNNQHNEYIFQFNPDLPLFVNEFLAGNDGIVRDEHGDADDFVELYNAGDTPINLNGFYLTDNFNRPDKWALPDTTIPAKGFLVVWADNQPQQGPMHATWAISKDGERLGLYKHTEDGFTVIDSLSFGPQTDDISYGRTVDGGPAWQYFTPPTPGQSNGVSTSIEELGAPKWTVTLHANFPNPFNPQTTIPFDLAKADMVELSVYNLLGQKLTTLVHAPLSAGSHQYVWNATNVSSGIYLYRLSTTSGTWTGKMVLVK